MYRELFSLLLLLVVDLDDERVNVGSLDLLPSVSPGTALRSGCIIQNTHLLNTDIFRVVLLVELLDYLPKINAQKLFRNSVSD